MRSRASDALAAIAGLDKNDPPSHAALKASKVKDMSIWNISTLSGGDISVEG